MQILIIFVISEYIIYLELMYVNDISHLKTCISANLLSIGFIGEKYRWGGIFLAGVSVIVCGHLIYMPPVNIIQIVSIIVRNDISKEQ